MSEFSCPLVRIGAIQKHPNADSLSITEVDGCPVVFKTIDFKEGDLAIYIPIEAVVPLDKIYFEFLKSPNHPEQTTARIKAKRLRGIFSMGFLIPAQILQESTKFPVGTDFAATLGVEKYEEPSVETPSSPTPKHPWHKTVAAWFRHPIDMYRITTLSWRNARIKAANFAPIYGMENLRKNRECFTLGERVYASEKIHGTNFRSGYNKGKFFVGSHRTWKGASTTDKYWQIAYAYNLQNRLLSYPHLTVYGEIYGDRIQDLTYGLKNGKMALVVFDLYDTNKKRFLEYDEFVNITNELGLPRPPLVYDGPYDSQQILEFSKGNSLIPGAEKQIREGVVVKSVGRQPRQTLKMVGEQYLLRKDGTEHH